MGAGGLRRSATRSSTRHRRPADRAGDAGTAIEFDDVSKSDWTGTRRKVVLERATFGIERGRSVGILAPDDSGKTTRST